MTQARRTKVEAQGSDLTSWVKGPLFSNPSPRLRPLTVLSKPRQPLGRAHPIPLVCRTHEMQDRAPPLKRHHSLPYPRPPRLPLVGLSLPGLFPCHHQSQHPWRLTPTIQRCPKTTMTMLQKVWKEDPAMAIPTARCLQTFLLGLKRVRLGSRRICEPPDGMPKPRLLLPARK